MINEGLIQFGYVVAAVCFILGLKKLSRVQTARHGNFLSAVGMLIALVVTLVHREIVHFEWISVGLLIGTVIGLVSAHLVKMTAMPQMVGLLNGFGGLASLLVGLAEYWSTKNTNISLMMSLALFFTVWIGSLTFSGSLVAFGKLAEVLPSRPSPILGQRFIVVMSFVLILALGGLFVIHYEPEWGDFAILAIAALGLLLGFLSVISIGGADMPVVISLLNSYSGLAACAAGFVVLNNVLIVAGSLVGASGLVLTRIMCKAMNRSLTHVLFGGFEKAKTSHSQSKETREPNPISVEDAYLLLEAANKVLIVPGYGMAVAQAQHAVSELGSLLIQKGAEVRYGIHPVAGRMPGHMNVLLAEANVPYELLSVPEEVNPQMESVDVCLVIGANDVTNPAAREEKASPIYGMPVINADLAKVVLVVKRSMATGFAGIENPLFYKPNTRMLFGDGKKIVSELVSEFKNE